MTQKLVTEHTKWMRNKKCVAACVRSYFSKNGCNIAQVISVWSVQKDLIISHDQRAHLYTITAEDE